MISTSINTLFLNQDLSRRILSDLCGSDLKNCALVNKIWYLAVRDSKSVRTLEITVERLKQLASKNQKLEDYLRQDRNFVHDIVVYGWSKGISIPNSVYDKLFSAELKAKRLVLRGRGRWDACHCPKKKSSCGEQFDTIEKQDLTNLEFIQINSTFHISACALLDLVSRSPKLKTLEFYGLISLPDHDTLFNFKRFYSDLVKIVWLWPLREHRPTLSTLVKRNENISTFMSNAATTCDLLASELLPNLKYLSLNLNEDWRCEAGNLKKAFRYLERIKYLSAAKNVEALEVRTFDISEKSEDSDTCIKVDRLYENYRLRFWQEVAKLAHLKYLAVYGAWEFEIVCREMAKHGLQVEYLKINLMPSSVIAAVEAQDDLPVLSMADGARSLRKLSQLRSLHFICYEKLGSIDTKTTAALKELMDLFWIIDIKTGFTEDVEELLNSMMRRGNQLGKTYKVHLHIQSKPDEYANLLVDQTLKFPTGVNLRAKLESLAEAEAAERYGKPAFENIQIWGLEQIGYSRDESMFERIRKFWQFYDEKFGTTPCIL